MTQANARACEARLIPYPLQPWPPRFRLYAIARGCQLAALALADDHRGELQLVKGYALAPDGSAWQGHWWCVDVDGRVVDPAWANEGRGYVGLAVVDPDEAVLTLGRLGVDEVAPAELVPVLERAAREA